MDIPDSELLEHLLQAGEVTDSFAEAGRLVNDRLDLDWSDSKWRGWFKRHPSEKEQVRKSLLYSGKKLPGIVNVLGNVKGVVVGDIHSPFHDRNAIRLVRDVIRWYKPDILIFNGDSMDFYHLSTFDQNPDRRFYAQDEIDSWHVDVVSVLVDAMPSGSRKYKTIGNHEDRLRKMIWKNQGLYGIRGLDYSQLFELDRFGIALAEQSVEFGSALHVTHGNSVSKWSGYTAKREAEQRRFQVSTITGHVHRQGRFQTAWRGQRVTAQEGACLCDLSPEYKTDPDWVQGFTLFEIKDGNVKIDPVEIFPDYTCSVGKNWFEVN